MSFLNSLSKVVERYAGEEARLQRKQQRLQALKSADEQMGYQHRVLLDMLDRKQSQAERVIALLKKGLVEGSVSNDVALMTAQENSINNITPQIMARLAGQPALAAKLNEYKAEIFKQLVQPAKDALQLFERENKKVLARLPKPEQSSDPLLESTPLPKKWFVPPETGGLSPVGAAVTKFR